MRFSLRNSKAEFNPLVYIELNSVLFNLSVSNKKSFCLVPRFALTETSDCTFRHFVLCGEKRALVTISGILVLMHPTPESQ